MLSDASFLAIHISNLYKKIYCIEATLKEFDRDELSYYVRMYERQQEIRKYMSEHGLCAFVTNGSILPRENGTSAPMANAIPFISPTELEVTIQISGGTDIVGMGKKVLLSSQVADIRVNPHFLMPSRWEYTITFRETDENMF